MRTMTTSKGEGRPPIRNSAEATSIRREGFGLLGLGAAACLACCAGPLLAFLGGLGVLGVASTLVVGAAGLAIAGVAVAGALVVRRRRLSACTGPVAPVAVGLTRRAPDSP